MKKLLFLVFFTTANSLNLCHARAADTTKQLKRWESFYSINKMDKTELSTLASGIYYLMQAGPSEPDKVSSTLTSICQAIKDSHVHHECYNALIKAYEQAVLAYAGKEGINKNRVWKETLSEYYQSLLNKLTTEPSQVIAFGQDKGKTLPVSFGKEQAIDLVMHNHIGRQYVKKPKNQIQVIQMSWHIRMI